MKLRTWQIWLATAALAGLSVIFAVPFMWMLSTSLKVDEKIQTEHLNLIPRATFIVHNGETLRVRPLQARGDMQEVQVYRDNRPAEKLMVRRTDLRDGFYLNTANYTEALRRAQFIAVTDRWPFVRGYLANTLIICVLTVTGTLLSCSLAAYGLACVEWRGRELLLWVMLSTMMLPGQVTMIPLFMTFRKLGWINTILPLVVPSFLGNAFFIFLLRQFYRSIPRDLIEAARIDGCGELGIWARIMLPLSRPALAVVALFTFIGSWNDFLRPLIYLMEESKYTMAIGLASFQGQYGGDWGQMMAMSLLMTVPIIVLFFFTQKTFIQGVKLAGIKG